MKWQWVLSWWAIRILHGTSARHQKHVLVIVQGVILGHFATPECTPGPSLGIWWESDEWGKSSMFSNLVDGELLLVHSPPKSHIFSPLHGSRGHRCETHSTCPRLPVFWQSSTACLFEMLWKEQIRYTSHESDVLPPGPYNFDVCVVNAGCLPC